MSLRLDDQPITAERIARARDIVARLVQINPEVLPIFTRLDEEHAEAVARQDPVAFARQMAKRGAGVIA